jgi:pimeloyl-ACP methyl ester carboxylesterase
VTTSQHRTTSQDGTLIAYERSGAGPPLVLVEAAGHHRGFSSFDGLVPLLEPHLTVVRYDRRGRGGSGDTAPYAVEREVDDLAAVIDDLGGPARLYGFSSGGLLALHAAAAGVPVPQLAALEPPIGDGETMTASGFTRDLTALVAAGRSSEAVEAFHEGIGVPAEVMAKLRGSPAWTAMAAIAPTLVYDAVIGDRSPPSLLARITVPVLVLDSEGSSDDLTGMAARVAKDLPRGVHRSLPGEWHGVPDADLAAALVEFFTAPAAPG